MGADPPNGGHSAWLRVGAYFLISFFTCALLRLGISAASHRPSAGSAHLAQAGTTVICWR